MALSFKLPTLNKTATPGKRGLSLGLELQILGTTFLLFLVIATYIVFVDSRTASYTAAYIAGTGQLRTLNQQIGKATWAAMAAGEFRAIFSASSWAASTPTGIPGRTNATADGWTL